MSDIAGSEIDGGKSSNVDGGGGVTKQTIVASNLKAPSSPASVVNPLKRVRTQSASPRVVSTQASSLTATDPNPKRKTVAKKELKKATVAIVKKPAAVVLKSKKAMQQQAKTSKKVVAKKVAKSGVKKKEEEGGKEEDVSKSKRAYKKLKTTGQESHLARGKSANDDDDDDGDAEAKRQEGRREDDGKEATDDTSTSTVQPKQPTFKVRNRRLARHFVDAFAYVEHYQTLENYQTAPPPTSLSIVPALLLSSGPVSTTSSDLRSTSSDLRSTSSDLRSTSSDLRSTLPVVPTARDSKQVISLLRRLSTTVADNATELDAVKQKATATNLDLQVRLDKALGETKALESKVAACVEMSENMNKTVLRLQEQLLIRDNSDNLTSLSSLALSTASSPSASSSASLSSVSSSSFSSSFTSTSAPTLVTSNTPDIEEAAVISQPSASPSVSLISTSITGPPPTPPIQSILQASPTLSKTPMEIPKTSIVPPPSVLSSGVTTSMVVLEQNPESKMHISADETPVASVAVTTPVASVAVTTPVVTIRPFVRRVIATSQPIVLLTTPSMPVIVAPVSQTSV